jgi:hypothetical protein
MIEDIKVEQRYGWIDVVTGPGAVEKAWGMTSYKILVLRDGHWSELRVEHINPQPPKEEKDD